MRETRGSQGVLVKGPIRMTVRLADRESGERYVSRVGGSLLGGAVGDALGGPLTMVRPLRRPCSRLLTAGLCFS